MYTLAFNINETLKLVYAQSALRALASSAEQKHPHIFDDDNEALLHVIFVNGFFTLAQAMMGYVIGYELDIDRHCAVHPCRSLRHRKQPGSG